MLCRGPLHFMVRVNRRVPAVLLTNHILAFPRGTSQPQVSYTPPPQALLIKNNLASREIKPTVAVKWHQLPEYPSTPPLASSHSNDSRLHRVLSPRPPPAPHYRRLTGPSAIWLLCTLDIYTEGGRDPHSHARKFNSQAFRAVAK